MYPDIEYPLDYGYIDGTSAPDGEGIDVFVGSAPGASLSAIAITLDEKKLDVEPKLLIACLPAEIEAVKSLFVAMHLPSIVVSRSAS